MAQAKKHTSTSILGYKPRVKVTPISEKSITRMFNTIYNNNRKLIKNLAKY